MPSADMVGGGGLVAPASSRWPMLTAATVLAAGDSGHACPRALAVETDPSSRNSLRRGPVAGSDTSPAHPPACIHSTPHPQVVRHGNDLSMCSIEFRSRRWLAGGEGIRSRRWLAAGEGRVKIMNHRDDIQGKL